MVFSLGLGKRCGIRRVRAMIMRYHIKITCHTPAFKYHIQRPGLEIRLPLSAPVISPLPKA